MDLYADLPPAKSDTNAAAADGKSSKPSVWAKGVPTFVPAAAQAKRNAPTVKTTTSMLPASLAGSRKSPDAAASRGGISLAFRPASIRKPQPASTTPVAFKPSTFNAEATATQSSNTAGSRAGANGTTTGLGFVAATTWTQVTVTQVPAADQASITGVADANPNFHFFQASYRDEYHPSRPNNYEAFCDERAAKRKMEQVKRDLEKRQRDQDRESQREREQFVKDVNAGKAPSLAMPLSAGRGRGMVVPAWMKKKIEESAPKPAPQSDDSRSVMAGVRDDQFEDAAPRMGLGFSGPQVYEDKRGSQQSRRDEFGREVVAQRDFARDRPSQRDHTPTSTSRSESRRRRSRSRSPDTTRRSHDHVSSSNRRHEPRSGGRFDVRSDQGHPPSQPCTGRVVLLQNMVGPGEVDDELQEEVKEECSSKYGPVTKCLVYEIRGNANPEEAVRIFVEFQHQAHADLAQKGLNSRFFGGRRVKATYYDEAKFARLELGA